MKLPVYQWQSLGERAQNKLLQRPAIQSSAQLKDDVRAIINDVQRRGDKAVKKYTQRFDNATIEALKVEEIEFANAELSLGFNEREAILQAIDNIRCFHEAQRNVDIDIETVSGMRCQRLTRPIRAVGLYVPSGSAPLPSAAMMLAIPASIAGCPTRVLCTPPNADGTVDPGILFAAHEAGVRDVYKIGGAQAIAAMAYGTESIPKVDKLFGPGNAFVTEAKSQVASDPLGAAQDMPAGPSEVLVIADGSANPNYVAADLLSQAEHGPDSQVLLLTDSAELIEHVSLAIERQLESLDRAEIITESLSHSALIEVDSIESAIAISNRYAPEHLIVNTKKPRRWLDRITAAGSVFLGPLTPESLGDYCSGTNHVLPTYGYARNYSGLGLEQFCLQMSVQEASPQGLANTGPVAEVLATLEGLDAHALAVRLRLDDNDVD